MGAHQTEPPKVRFNLHGLYYSCILSFSDRNVLISTDEENLIQIAGEPSKNQWKKGRMGFKLFQFPTNIDNMDQKCLHSVRNRHH